jgi:hypothetical protein
MMMVKIMIIVIIAIIIIIMGHECKREDYLWGDQQKEERKGKNTED